jgi:hypothetical protein
MRPYVAETGGGGKESMTFCGFGWFFLPLTLWKQYIGPNNQDTPMGVYEAYGAMTPQQAQSYHSLVQAFNAAKDPATAHHFSGDYAAKITEFGRELQGGHVLASRTQLEGLTAIARAAATFAKDDTKFDKIDAFWQTHVHDNPRMTYRHGLLNHLV